MSKTLRSSISNRTGRRDDSPWPRTSLSNAQAANPAAPRSGAGQAANKRRDEIGRRTSISEPRAIVVLELRRGTLRARNAPKVRSISSMARSTSIAPQITTQTLPGA